MDWTFWLVLIGLLIFAGLTGNTDSIFHDDDGKW